jgi:hypothetical protein
MRSPTTSVVIATLVVLATAGTPASVDMPDSQDAASITEASVRGHMEFLASDALNGRGSMTRDEWIAATYVGSRFRQWGLEPMGDDGGFVQRIEIMRSVVSSPPTLRAGTLEYRHGVQVIATAVGGVETSGPLVVYTPDAAIPAGAVVLLPANTPANVVADAGAVALLSAATAQMRSQWTARAGRLPTLPARIGGVAQPARPRPAAVVLDDEAHAAMSQLPAGTVVTITADVSEGEPGHSWNAVGRLTGSDPQQAAEVIVLSAHLDHVGARDVAPGEDGINNGADDDASGTIAVLELAEALARGPRPKRTIVFAAFGSEERGGFGAGYFVDRPVVPLKAIVADLQFEMLGRPDELVPPHTLWLTGYERSDLGAELAKQGARLVADPHPDQGFFTRSDNIRFARRGVVAHTVSSFGLHTDYHRPSDEIDTIDFAHMTDAIRSLVEPIRWFANSTFRPAWAPDGCPAPCGQ